MDKLTREGRSCRDKGRFLFLVKSYLKLSMDRPQLKNFTTVKESNKPVVAVIGIVLVLNLTYFLILKGPIRSFYADTLYIAVMLLPIFYLFKPRGCSSL